MKYLRMALLPTLALALAACADVSPVSPRSVRDGTPNPNKATTKTDVCHHSEELNSYILISVAQPALQAHLAHGDGQPAGPVPGQPGFQFGPDCAPQFVGLELAPAADGYVHLIQSPPMHPPEDVLSVFDSPQEILVSRLFFANQLIENQGVVEFHIAGIPGPVGHAELHLPVINTIRPFGLGVFSYAGNGAVDVSDFASGSLVSVYLLGMNPVPPNGTITVDVTNAINSLIAAHASFAGFNLRVMQPPNDEGTIVLNDPTLSITAP